jgi:hypothetical protein
MSRTKREKRQAPEQRVAAKAVPIKAKLSGTELKAFVRRFPVPSSIALGINLACIVFGNAYLLWLVWGGQLSLTGLILLVFTEGVLLSTLEALQRRSVPAAHRLQSEVVQTLPQQAIGWIGYAVGIGGAYFMWIFLTKETAVLDAYCTSFDAWRDSGLDIAIGMTLLFATAGLFADQAHYRRSGPPLVSSVSLEALTRRITFTYGAFVFAIPLFGLTALAIWAIKRAVGKRDGDGWNFLGGVAVITAFFSIFFAMAKTIDSGPHGWAAVYLSGKAVVEGLFAFLPVLAKRAATAESKR